MPKSFEFSWLNERVDQYDESCVTFDPSAEILIEPRWEGIYRIRLLPVQDPMQFLRQAGYHWNVFPTDENTKFSRVGCPRFTYQDDCCICDAINKACAEKKRVYKDFTGEGGIAVQRRAIVSCLLVDFEPAPSAEKNAPKFKDLPQIKLFAVPAFSIGKEIGKKCRDEKDFGVKAMLNETTGRIIKLEKNKNIQPGRWRIDVLGEPWPIPSEFLDEELWPDVGDFLPTERDDDLRSLVMLNLRDVDPVIANFVASVDIEGGRVQKQLPEGAEPTSKRGKSLKDTLANV